MKVTSATAVLLSALGLVGLGALRADPPPDLKRDGAFAFPQAQAEVLCDAKDLRLSVWNDAKYLYVQTIVWEDGYDAVERTRSLKRVWGWSALSLDVDADQRRTPNVDRIYGINSHPTQMGLSYQVVLGDRRWTTLRVDSKGRGAIRYLEVGKVQRVRVDSYVIPLDEIGRKAGDKIRLAYWAQCPKPERCLNSIGFESKDPYIAVSLPLNKYHEITLADRPASLDIAQVPDGQKDKAPPERDTRMPSVGTVPPEFSAKEWLNTDAAPTLAGLKDKVVLVVFWHQGGDQGFFRNLNKLDEDYGRQGLTVIAITLDGRVAVERAAKNHKLKFILGAQSNLASEYGVTGFDHAFLIGKDGKVLWDGGPDDKDLDQRIPAALK
jgi:peroxiredoxin